MERDKKKRRQKPKPALDEVVAALAAAALRGSLREAERALLKRYLYREPPPRPALPPALDERFCPVCRLRLPEPRPEICPSCRVVLSVAWDQTRRSLQQRKKLDP